MYVVSVEKSPMLDDIAAVKDYYLCCPGGESACVKHNTVNEPCELIVRNSIPRHSLHV